METSNSPNAKGRSKPGASPPKQFDAAAKKMLEKMYARVFDLSTGQKGRTPELTEEGQLLVLKANIQPQDLVPRSYEDFLKMERAAH